MKSKMNNVKQFSGDGLRIDLDSNDKVLKVSGDGCMVTLSSNVGSIRMVGDGCSLTVKNNSGDIEYQGDGGRVTLGPESQSDRVKYVGDGGQVSFGGKTTRAKPREDRKNKCMSTPDMDNLANHRKEASMRGSVAAGDEGLKTARSPGQRKTEKSLRRSKTITNIVVTRITHGTHTVAAGDEALIRNWFRDPAAVTRSFSASCTDSVQCGRP